LSDGTTLYGLRSRRVVGWFARKGRKVYVEGRLTTREYATIFRKIN
jgi:single-stranded DNA-binding protein